MSLRVKAIYIDTKNRCFWPYADLHTWSELNMAYHFLTVSNVITELSNFVNSLA